ncbi:hypothetical protein K8I85_04375, partial [bacterium]|nr:hypothetical protein [bacterium]
DVLAQPSDGTPVATEERMSTTADADSAQRKLLARIAELEMTESRAATEQEQLEKRIAELERGVLGSAAARERLEARLADLEAAKRAQEEATRSIIRQTLDTLGSRINEYVIFGGTLEVGASDRRNFDLPDETNLELNTAELDFEIDVNDWTVASLILEYLDGSDVARAPGGGDTPVDRINVDTAFLTLGDSERFWLSAVIGQMVIPFGISTGDPVADVLTLDDPLTVAAFEMTEVAVLLGASFPTPPPRPATLRAGPPPVRPKVLAPFIGKLSRALGHRPYPVPPPAPNFIASTPPTPPFSLGLVSFHGKTYGHRSDEDNWTPVRHAGVVAGAHLRGTPWSIDVDAHWNSSVFDSDFLGVEYANFLDRIGLVPGLAVSLKTTYGPVGLVVERTGSLEHTRFEDDAGRRTRIRPSAWQASLGYQFGWNPSVEAIGSQGTYAAVGYSESRDLAGVTAMVGDANERVGTVPRRRFLATAGEWVLEGVRVALEYSYEEDYPRTQGGTGRSAEGVSSVITMEW